MDTNLILNLVEKVKNGDESSFKKLCSYYSEVLCLFASRYIDKSYFKQDVDDITSDTLLSILETCKSYDNKSGYRFETYLSWWLFMNLYIKKICGFSLYEKITKSKDTIKNQMQMVMVYEEEFCDKHGYLPSSYEMPEIFEDIYSIKKVMSDDKKTKIATEHIAQFRYKFHI